LTTTQFGAPQQVVILAEALPFTLLSISPDKVGKGPVTTTLKGAGFRTGTQFSLRNSGNAVVATGFIRRLYNSMKAEVQWNLTNLPQGTYEVAAVNPDSAEV